MIAAAKQRWPNFIYKIAFSDSDELLDQFEGSSQTFDYIIFLRLTIPSMCSIHSRTFATSAIDTPA